MGKSQIIYEAIQSSKDRMIYARIPFYGELNRDTLVALHEKRVNIDDANNDGQHSVRPIGFHYDVYPTDNHNKDLNVVMFELLMLGTLNDNTGHRFNLPENSRIYIELS